jgi:hypothetical protein
MDTLQDIFLTLTALSHVELMLGLLITGTVIIALEGWRLNLWALIAQSVLVGVLLARVIPAEVALIKIIVGGMVCLILYLTARRAYAETEMVATSGIGQTPRVGSDVFSMNLWFRLLVALLAGVVSTALGDKHPFIDQPLGISQACYWLVSIGLLTIVLSRDPFKVGLGLLTFQAGFDILLATFEQSLSVAALVGVVHLLTALAIAYLTSAQTVLAVEDDIA